MRRDDEEADFRLEEGSYLRLRRAIKFVTGMSERCEGGTQKFRVLLTRDDDFIDEWSHGELNSTVSTSPKHK